MKQTNFVNPLKIAYRGDIKRIEEDNKRLTESSIGAEEMIDLLTGKQKKPRAIRDWEKHDGGK